MGFNSEDMAARMQQQTLAMQQVRPAALQALLLHVNCSISSTVCLSVLSTVNGCKPYSA